MEIAGQIIGFIAVGEGLLVFIQKTHKKILLFKIISDFLWMTHLFLLHAYTGATLNGTMIIRDTVFYNNDKKWAQSKWWLFGFMIFFIFTTAFSWNGYISIIPLIGSEISMVSLFVHSERKMRLLSIPANLLWLGYYCYIFSISGIIGASLYIVSAIIGLIRGKSKA